MYGVELETLDVNIMGKENILYLMLVILFLSGCIDKTQQLNTSSETPANATNELVVGALLPLSGDLAFSGEAAKTALEVALEDVSTYLSDEEPGMKVRLVIEDTETSPSVAVEKIRKLKDAGAIFVIGTDSSAELEAVKPFADANGIILISYGSTAPSLSIAGDNVFRLLPSDEYQAEALAALMWKDGIKAVVPIWRGDVWGDGLHNAVETKFEALGGVMHEGVRYDPETDFSAEVDALSAEVSRAVNMYGKDKVAVHYMGFNEAATLFDRAKNNTALKVRWYGSDGTALDSNLISNSGVASFAVETGFVTPFYSVEIKDLEERVKALYGAAHVFGLVAYDALWLSTLTYTASNKSTDINVLKKVLTQIAASYQGATGLTELNEAGDRRFTTYDIWAIRETNGTFNWERVGKYPD